MTQKLSKLSRYIPIGIAIIISLTNFADLASAQTIKVKTTTTELAWLTEKLGGSLVEVESFLSGAENPHFIDATPSMALAARDADIIIAVGADLEVGWLPRVMERSGNVRVHQNSNDGSYCEVARELELHGKIDHKVDRSMGHVHSEGNPHFWYSLKKMREAALVIRNCLRMAITKVAKDTNGSLLKLEDNFLQLEDKFQNEQNRLTNIIDQRQAKNDLIVEMHEDFSYLTSELKIASLGGLEDKPGIKPSAGRLAEVAKNARERGAKALLYTSLDSEQIAQKFSELSSIPIVQIQAHLMGKKTSEREDYFKVYWKNTEAIMQAIKRPKI